MKKIRAATPRDIPGGASAALFFYRKGKEPVPAVPLPKSAAKTLKMAVQEGFEGKSGQTHIVHSLGGGSSRNILIGLGKEKEVDVHGIRAAAARAAGKAEAIQIPSLAIPLPSMDAPEKMAQAVTEGVLLGTYRFTEYKGKKPPAPKLTTVYLCAQNKNDVKSVKKGINDGQIFSKATLMTRDLVNQPPSDLTPEIMVQRARSLQSKTIKLQVLDKKKVEQMGMGAFLGVNRGSDKPPYFLHFTYKPANGKVNRRIGLVGKGVTFDSGGLSLKPSKGMETMKMDMAGAATVVGVFSALEALQPSVEVQGFAPLTENMPSGGALKPGDVLKAMNGKTIEVLNTDAEGRLILADALCYVSQQKCDEVVDLATLTGACIVALGNSITAIMGTSPELVQKIMGASKETGEKMWELPLEKEYESHIKSPVADVKNMGRSGQAGTIIGGLFLKEFMDTKIPWVHLDIAGPAWADEDTPLARTGGTGAMVRTLLHHILSYN